MKRLCFKLKSTAVLALVVSSHSAIAGADFFDAARRGLFGDSGECTQEMLADAHSHAQSKLKSLRDTEDVTIDSFCASLRQSVVERRIACYAKCESNFSGELAERKEARLRSERTRIEEEQRVNMAEQEKRAAAERRRDDLKSGRVKPGNFDEAAFVYNSRDGVTIAMSPKLKPDGGMYHLHGKIKLADAKPVFYAVTSPSKADQMGLLVYNLRGIGRQVTLSESSEYIKVLIPKQLQEYYFDNARLEGGFDMVGRYVANTGYPASTGYTTTAPVFEAVYFAVW